MKLLHFVELNATGIRKILKKHDKTLKEHKIMGSYLSSRTDSQASHLQQLYHDEGISAIIASIRSALTKLRKLEVQLAADATSKTLTRTISEDEPVLNRIGQARRRLHKSTQYVKTVAARSLIFDSESSEDEDDETYDMLKRLKQASEPSRLLNMLNTFLYMTNYYIVAPTSGKYAAELGAEASMSGVIVGMTPVASLASAVLYSWWANRSYKASLSFATVCLILGNLLYGMALSYDSVAMALTGRMLNGFGGARAINRRYIADNYSGRTHAGFGSVRDCKRAWHGRRTRTGCCAALPSRLQRCWHRYHDGDLAWLGHVCAVDDLSHRSVVLVRGARSHGEGALSGAQAIHAGERNGQLEYRGSGG